MELFGLDSVTYCNFPKFQSSLCLSHSDSLTPPLHLLCGVFTK